MARKPKAQPAADAPAFDPSAWPASRSRMRKVADLVPYANNARTHSDEQVAQIAASMREFGFTMPVLIRAETDGIIAGHGRILGASLIGWDEVPTIEAVGWSDAQVKAYVIADNKLSLNAGWDEALLAAELRDLADMGYDTDLTGFSQAEIADMDPDRAKGLVDPDEVPDTEDTHVTRRGDVWLLGPHRVGCGDSCNPDVLARAMAEGLADAVWTDPPYNVDFKGKKAGKIENDNLDDPEFLDFISDAMLATYGQMKPGAPIYVAHAHMESGPFVAAFKGAGLKLSAPLIWAKVPHVIGRADYHWQHEAILYGWRPGATHRWYGDRKEKTVIDTGKEKTFTRNENGDLIVRVGQESLIIRGTDIDVIPVEPTVLWEVKGKDNALHPTVKPVELIARMLRNSTRTGDVVLDPFGGSGSTLIACETMGRVARLNELEPKFVDVIVRRWQLFTGKAATLDGDGRTFDRIATEGHGQ